MIGERALLDGLRRLGYDAFRPGQREAIETLLEKRRLLLVAPTGGGKSLAYQLPASLLPGTTLVISPLVALMDDQVRALSARGVPATYLASTLSGAEVRTRMGQMAGGRYKIVYAAPERMAFEGFRGLVRDLAVPLIAVDEAHCISEWGHDFRPEYMQLSELLADKPEALVLACTATATPVVRDEIVARLALPADTPQIVRGFARPSLVLRALEVATARDRAVRTDAALLEALGEPGNARGVAIVYAATRRSAEEEGARLQRRGWRVAVYHAGLEAEARVRGQEAFSTGTIDVIVATNAFGMGIDRPDVRAVIHLAPPGSIEAYYQEVGRAGRDGEKAYGLLLTTPSDLPLRRHLIERGGGAETADPVLVAHKWSMFLELMRWVEGGSCRHDAILRYFGDEAETLHGCGRCDCCLTMESAVDAEEVTLVVRKALSGVARVSSRFGLTAAVKLLHGDADPRLERAGLDKVSTFGVLRDHPEEWLTRLLRRLVTAGWVDFTAGERPMVVLTEDGRAVMHAQRPARILLPPRETVAAAAGGRSGSRGKQQIPLGTAADALDPQAERLFEALRSARLRLAREEGVPPFVVASDRTLREIARARPRDSHGLLAVHGIGPAKVERYGPVWLDVVSGFRAHT